MTIRIGTNEEGGTFHSQGVALGDMLERETGLGPVEIVTSWGASVANARQLHEGALDFGFSAANWIGKALRGEDPFDEPIALRMAAPANVGPMFFVTLADSDLRTVDDLRGRRVSIGIEDSGMVQHIRTIFGVLGIGFDEFEPVYFGFEEGAEALTLREIDAQWQCPIPNDVMTELANRADVRVLGWPPAQMEKVLSAVSVYRPTTMPAGAFRGLDSDSRQVGVLNVIATHEREPEATVEAVVTAMVKNADALGAAVPLYAGLGALFEQLRTRGRESLEPGGVPLHPGAVAAYRKAGLLD